MEISRSGSSCLTVFIITTTLLACIANGSTLVEEYACFNRVLDVECEDGKIIVFEGARYGRNDSQVARSCRTIYQRNCDVDVHFTLNRKCAGRQKCHLAVNTALFGDPCGYEEFLKVSYRCIDVSSLYRTCHGPGGPVFYERGYLSSPNYPVKYYMDAVCLWKLSVQKRQNIRITLLDFELDVKKRGKCQDVLEILTDDRVLFRDCGALGRQEIFIESNEALVRFTTAPTSLAQRGFLVYFEAIGPGCPDLEPLQAGWVEYYMEGETLYANASCHPGFQFSGTEISEQRISCTGSFWSATLSPCVVTPPSTTQTIPEAPTIMVSTGGKAPPLLQRPESLVGIALGVVSAILLITLLLVLALYFHKRRRNAEKKLDQWRVVINNLQENAMNEENMKRSLDQHSNLSPTCNITPSAKRSRGKKNKNNMTVEDEMQGKKLLSTIAYDEDDLEYYGDPKDGDTPVKILSDDPRECGRCGSRRSSWKGNNRGLIVLPGGVVERRCAAPKAVPPPPSGYQPVPEHDLVSETRGRQRSRRDLRHQRTRSGHIESGRGGQYERSPMYVSPPLAPEKRELTQSAPDLLAAVINQSPQVQPNTGFHRENSMPVTSTQNRRTPPDPPPRVSSMSNRSPPPPPPGPVESVPAPGSHHSGSDCTSTNQPAAYQNRPVQAPPVPPNQQYSRPNQLTHVPGSPPQASDQRPPRHPRSSSATRGQSRC